MKSIKTIAKTADLAGLGLYYDFTVAMICFLFSIKISNLGDIKIANKIINFFINNIRNFSYETYLRTL